MKYETTIAVYIDNELNDNDYASIEDFAKDYSYVNSKKEISSDGVADFSTDTIIYNSKLNKSFNINKIRVQLTGVKEVRIDLFLKEKQNWFVV